MKKQLISMAAALTFLFMATISPADQNCGEMLQGKCTNCHYKTRICKEVGEKNRRSWKNTAKRMVRYGLKISDTEIDEIVGCLVSLEENPKIFCD